MSSWLGKIIGGAVGLTLGGPLGMIAGIAFGNLFDASKRMKTELRGEDNHLEKDQMLFFVGTFSLLGRMAIADGKMVPQERSVVENFIQNDLKLDPAARDAAYRVFNAALSTEMSIEQIALQFYQNFANQSSIIELLVDILVRVAVADGSIANSEMTILNQVCRIFNFGEAKLNRVIEHYLPNQTKLKQDYATLGLTESASLDEVKKAYRKLSRDFHPDTIASKGLPEEFTHFATEKFRSIQQAYERISKANQ